LNLAQLGAPITMMVVGSRLAGRRWPFAMVGSMIAVAAIGLATAPGAWVVFWAVVMG
jgi:hypothetical protein